MDALISPRRRAMLHALGAAALLTGCGRFAPATRAHAFHGPTMGTSYKVKLHGPGVAPAAAREAHAAVTRAFAAVVRSMSLFEAESELSRFNRQASSEPFAVSADTFAVFEIAQRVSASSAGAFDATIAPVVAAWGFGPAQRHAIPGAGLLSAAHAAVGWRGLALDSAARTVAKRTPAIAVDFSAIAKGYAVDVAARALDALGHERYMVEAGGEVRTRGMNPEGQPWQIGIERPDAPAPRPHFVVPLEGLALATSGDYRIFFEADGRRYCHEIDPSSGVPIAHRLASVSVVSADCAYADAMATALIVLGPERGYALAVEREVAAYFILRMRDGSLRDFASPAFAALGGHRYA
jgi:thiamine biosynthesis lipoprotein